MGEGIGAAGLCIGAGLAFGLYCLAHGLDSVGQGLKDIADAIRRRT